MTLLVPRQLSTPYAPRLWLPRIGVERSARSTVRGRVSSTGLRSPGGAVMTRIAECTDGGRIGRFASPWAREIALRSAPRTRASGPVSGPRPGLRRRRTARLDVHHAGLGALSVLTRPPSSRRTWERAPPALADAPLLPPRARTATGLKRSGNNSGLLEFHHVSV
jgi:hypothetical protein